MIAFVEYIASCVIFIDTELVRVSHRTCSGVLCYICCSLIGTFVEYCSKVQVISHGTCLGVYNILFDDIVQLWFQIPLDPK